MEKGHDMFRRFLFMVAALAAAIPGAPKRPFLNKRH